MKSKSFHERSGEHICWIVGIALLVTLFNGEPEAAKAMLVLGAVVGGYGTFLSARDWWRKVWK